MRQDVSVWLSSCRFLFGGMNLVSLLLTTLNINLNIGDKIMYGNEWLPEVFNSFFNSNMPRVNATAPAINVAESKDDYIVELAAPGLKKEDFDVTINADGDLRIKMENRREKEETHVHYLRREFALGKYERTLLLPEDVDKARIEASVADGVLTVKLPKLAKAEAQVARQIEIG